MTPNEQWRLLAKRFRCISRFIRIGKLPENYQPCDLIELHAHGSLSTSEHSVVGFLLHVWNKYEFKFELPDMLLWDPDHQKAFVNWANGQTLGQPLWYC